MAKSRLRALNTTNDSVVPVHNDLKIKSLQKSWKVWYQILTSLLLSKNNKIKLQRSKHKTNISLGHHRTRKLKQTIFASHLFFGTVHGIVINKKYLTSVKVILVDNKIFIVLLICPTYKVSGTLRRAKNYTKKKKTVSKFKFNKRFKLKSRKGKRINFIKRLKLVLRSM